MSSAAGKQRMTVDDFITGLLAQLALGQRRVVPINDEAFDAAVERAFLRLEEVAPEYNLDIRFWISRHPFHGDSPVVRQAISAAIQRDLVSLDNPAYKRMRLKISEHDAKTLLERLPGGESLFRVVAEPLVRIFETEPGPHPSAATSGVRMGADISPY